MFFGPPTASENDPIPKDAFTMEFRLPGSIRFKMPMGEGASYMFFFATPLTQDTCRMDWILTNFNPKSADGITWGGEGREIIEEDQMILEAIQDAYRTEGESFEKSVEADIPTLTLRRMMKLAEAGKNGESGQMRRLVMMPAPARFEI